MGSRSTATIRRSSAKLWRLIRSTQKWRLAVRNVARHPQLRAALHLRIFWKPSHGRLLLAGTGLLLARRVPLAALALAPYLALQRTQHGSYAGTLVALPAHVVLDAAEMVAMVRGSLDARTLVL